jgi:nitrite reductase/ring-hydroxylating ferredoxin subunit
VGELKTSPVVIAAGARVCESSALSDGGPGVRFDIERNGATVAAFVVRYRGKAYAYLNRCAHRFVELDWEPGRFFDFSSQYLVCATHGALYEPDTGHCAAGPCRGAKLVPLAVVEADGAVWLAEPAADVLK